MSSSLCSLELKLCLYKNKNKFKNLQIPILVIGTKADIVDDAQRIKQLQRTGNIGTNILP